MNRNQQLAEARTLGLLAFYNGTKRVPALDADLLPTFTNRKIGETPDGEASSIQIMNAWMQGWDDGNFDRLPPVPESIEFDHSAHYEQC